MSSLGRTASYSGVGGGGPGLQFCVENYEPTLRNIPED